MKHFNLKRTTGFFLHTPVWVEKPSFCWRFKWVVCRFPINWPICEKMWVTVDPPFDTAPALLYCPFHTPLLYAPLDSDRWGVLDVLEFKICIKITLLRKLQRLPCLQPIPRSRACLAGDGFDAWDIFKLLSIYWCVWNQLQKMRAPPH